MKDVIRPWIEKSACITEPYRGRLLQTLDGIPSPKTCLHGDFHIGNIITNGEKDYSDRILQRVGGGNNEINANKLKYRLRYKNKCLYLHRERYK